MSNYPDAAALQCLWWLINCRYDSLILQECSWHKPLAFLFELVKDFKYIAAGRDSGRD